MQRMRGVVRPGRPVSPCSSCWPELALPAHADLIRPAPGRSFPDIAGDIGGSQTYVYDPATQTGTFRPDQCTAPDLARAVGQGPDPDAARPRRHPHQSLELKLDRSGRLIDSPAQPVRDPRHRRHQRPGL